MLFGDAPYPLRGIVEVKQCGIGRPLIDGPGEHQSAAIRQFLCGSGPRERQARHRVAECRDRFSRFLSSQIERGHVRAPALPSLPQTHAGQIVKGTAKAGVTTVGRRGRHQTPKPVLSVLTVQPLHHRETAGVERAACIL